jgi:uncharacterized membrane protein YphA (DoxX/SURF4 family)
MPAAEGAAMARRMLRLQENVIPSQGDFRIDTRPSNQGQSVTIRDTAARCAPYVLSMVRIVAGAIELVGGALLALGLFTRPVALIMSGEMAFAYFISHAPAGFFPILNRGDAAILYCFIFLYIAFAGGGPWSVDALMGRKINPR